MSSQDLPKRPRVTPTYPERSQWVPSRSCLKCGGTTFVTKEGLLKCFNCKFKWQSAGFNYQILENRTEDT